MTLPTAVASGVEPSSDDDFVPVRPLRAGVVAGVLAAVYLIVVYLAQPVPARFVRFAGGHGDAIGRSGGARLVWRPPAGSDVRRVRAELDEHGTTTVMRADGTVEILLGGVSADEIQAVAEGLTQKRLEFHEVLEAPEMEQLVQVLQLPIKDQWPLDGEIGQWRDETGVGVHTEYYLRARSKAELDAALDKARSLGWAPPRGSHIAYERHENDQGTYWRTYLLADEVAFDGEGIATASGIYDPNTNRPVVLVEMTRAGAQQFGELTARIVGKKLAICSGDEVRSAPVIEGAIRGGRAQIRMGAGDVQKEERDRDVLVKVLKAGSLPAGGTLLSQEVVAPSDTPLQMWIGRALLGLAGGFVVGLLAWIIVRVARPVRRRIPRSASGPRPVSRILVTLLAPAAVVALSHLPIPGVATEARLFHSLDLGSIGIAPLVTAAVLAELLAVTIWRKRRHGGPVARRPIRDAYVVLAIALTALQAWTIATYLQSITYDDLMEPSAYARLEVVLAFGAATAALAAVARIVRNWGLGNGYGALVAAGWCVALVNALRATDTAGCVALIAQIVVVVLVVGVVLRWRVYGAGEAMLRVPTSGIVPAAYVRLLGMALAIVGLSGLFPVYEVLQHAVRAIVANAAARYALAGVFVVAFSAAFAWPRAIPAARGGLAPTSWRSWGRATAVSLALVGALLAIVVAGHPQRVADLIAVPIVAAFALDAFDDWRARRVELDRVWTVHSTQRAELVERQLRDAGIPCHLAGAHLRTILGGFGAFAPIDVLVPTEHVPAARTLLEREDAS